ncbi:hypothetical protein PMAYCL1PPCAC_03410, partial [Pristionchus mayeri]
EAPPVRTRLTRDEGRARAVLQLQALARRSAARAHRRKEGSERALPHRHSAAACPVLRDPRGPHHRHHQRLLLLRRGRSQEAEWDLCLWVLRLQQGGPALLRLQLSPLQLLQELHGLQTRKGPRRSTTALLRDLRGRLRALRPPRPHRSPAAPFRIRPTTVGHPRPTSSEDTVESIEGYGRNGVGRLTRPACE